jgi:hypothetical protein
MVWALPEKKACRTQRGVKSVGYSYVIREGLVWLNTLASKTVWGTILLKTI